MILRLKNIAVALCPVLVAGILAGCSGTMVVSRQGDSVLGDTLSVETLNSRIAGKRVTLTMRDGTSMEAEIVALGIDSCTLSPDGSVPRRALPSGAIAVIEHRDHSIGAINGLVIGGLGCFAIGELVSNVVTNDRPRQAATPLVLTVMGGGCVGMGLGAIVGAPRRYRIELAPGVTNPAYMKQGEETRVGRRIVVHEEITE